MGQEALVSHLHHEETSPLIYVVAVIIFVVCLSNILTIFCTLFVQKFKMVINIYLMALAIDDIIIGNICMPLTLLEQMGLITYGPAMCHFLPYLQGFAVAAELWMRVVISIERYYAIVHPITSRKWQTIPHALRMIAYIWLASGLVCIHILFVSTLQQKKDGGAYQCRQKWPTPQWERAVNVTQFIIFFIIPFCIVALGYMLISRRLRQRMREEPIYSIRYNIRARSQTTNSSGRQEYEAGTSGISLSVKSRADLNTDQTPRSSDSESGTMRSTHSHSAKSIADEKKVIWTLFIIVIEFFICWLPLHIVNLIYLYDTERVSTTNRVLLITQFMGYISTCFNPIIYFLINANFQEMLRAQWPIMRHFIRRNEAQEAPSCQTTTTTGFNEERPSCVINIQHATPTPSESSSVSPVVTATYAIGQKNLSSGFSTNEGTNAITPCGTSK